jgi:ethanolamine utilization cobalamin adenosyltransferase
MAGILKAVRLITCRRTGNQRAKYENIKLINENIMGSDIKHMRSIQTQPLKYIIYTKLVIT